MTARQIRIVAALYQAQGGRCFYCGGPMDDHKFGPEHGNGWTRDHVVPRCSGAQRAGNIVLAHYRCNRRKGSRQPQPTEMIRARLMWRHAVEIWSATSGQPYPRRGLIAGRESC